MGRRVGEARQILRHLLVGSEPTLAARWSEHRDEILVPWVTMRPGTRPFAWWRYDSPGARQRVGDGLLESEAAFLRRHGLLVPAERRALPRGAFAWVPCPADEDEEQEPLDISQLGATWPDDADEQEG